MLAWDFVPTREYDYDNERNIIRINLVDTLIRLVHEEQEATKCQAEPESSQRVINFQVLLGTFRYL